MEYNVPKVLERNPIIAGFDLKSVLAIVIGALVFILTVFSHFLIALLVPASVGSFLYIQKKYPKQGEFTEVINYQSGIKCVQANVKIDHLIMVKNSNSITT